MEGNQWKSNHVYLIDAAAFLSFFSLYKAATRTVLIPKVVLFRLTILLAIIPSLCACLHAKLILMQEWSMEQNVDVETLWLPLVNLVLLAT